MSVLIQTAARDHIADDIRVNAISPGARHAPMSYRSGEIRTDRAARPHR
ncbi:hypothetical protein ABGB07_32105 [Micromonosporaceae bacterium B7E4]